MKQLRLHADKYTMRNLWLLAASSGLAVLVLANLHGFSNPLLQRVTIVIGGFAFLASLVLLAVRILTR